MLEALYIMDMVGHNDVDVFQELSGLPFRFWIIIMLNRVNVKSNFVHYIDLENRTWDLESWHLK